MESFIQNHLSTYEDVNEELLLERRISPYVTLRPGDLAALISLHSALPISQKLNRNYGSNSTYTHPKIDSIFNTYIFGPTPGQSDDDKIHENDVAEYVCRCSEQGHVPVEYKVKGLKRHEVPVIGFFVDKAICPGFQYHVRKIDSTSFLWGNKPRTLESIGRGYGCRLTFAGDTLNSRDCYFWSDSEPNGFAFSIQAVEAGQKFIIQDSYDRDVGEATIDKICGPQEEVSTDAGKNGVTKRVCVTVSCNMTYYQRHYHGLKGLVSPKNQELITGQAVLSKPRSSRKAVLVTIEKVFLPRIGRCKLIPDL